MRGLYAIVDVDATERVGGDVLSVARAVIEARPAALQLRAKSLSTRDHLDLLKRLATMADSAGIPFFANDRPDLAVLARCRGVHVGQGDLPVDEVRRFAPHLRVGISTHSMEQLRAALDARPDYVAFGPVFPTGSKEHPDPTVGLEGLRQAWGVVGGAIPLVAIGGIDVTRVAEVVGVCDCVAIIGALLGPAGTPGTAARARALIDAFSVSP